MREHSDLAAERRSRVARDWQQTMTLPRWFPAAGAAVLSDEKRWSEHTRPWLEDCRARNTTVPTREQRRLQLLRAIDSADRALYYLSVDQRTGRWTAIQYLDLRAPHWAALREAHALLQELDIEEACTA